MLVATLGGKSTYSVRRSLVHLVVHISHEKTACPRSHAHTKRRGLTAARGAATLYTDTKCEYVLHPAERGGEGGRWRAPAAVSRFGVRPWVRRHRVSGRGPGEKTGRYGRKKVKIICSLCKLVKVCVALKSV